jgi:hypothetical protein
MLTQHMFNDLAHENPNQHLAMFEKLCNTDKINSVEPEAIKLKAFPLVEVLRYRCNKNNGPIYLMFFSKYFSSSKTFIIREQITNFRQKGGESLSEAWDKY